MTRQPWAWLQNAGDSFLFFVLRRHRDAIQGYSKVTIYTTSDAVQVADSVELCEVWRQIFVFQTICVHSYHEFTQLTLPRLWFVCRRIVALIGSVTLSKWSAMPVLVILEKVSGLSLQIVTWLRKRFRTGKDKQTLVWPSLIMNKKNSLLYQ